jgi:predicted ATPase
MVISFSGAQSTGKTTLLKICQKQSAEVLSIFSGFKFVPEVTRLVKSKYNLPINEDGTNLTQLCIINQHLENYLTLKDSNVIMDRCILDGIIYTEYLVEHGIVDEFVLDYAKHIFNILIDKIDIIFYTDPSIPLLSDGERSENIEFREEIIKKFNKYLPTLKNVVVVKGTVEDRLDKITRTIILTNEKTR